MDQEISKQVTDQSLVQRDQGLLLWPGGLEGEAAEASPSSSYSWSLNLLNVVPQTWLRHPGLCDQGGQCRHSIRDPCLQISPHQSKPIPLLSFNFNMRCLVLPSPKGLGFPSQAFSALPILGRCQACLGPTPFLRLCSNLSPPSQAFNTNAHPWQPAQATQEKSFPDWLLSLTLHWGHAMFVV